MDIAYQFEEIRVFFADDGFVSVLEEMPGAFVSFVEGNCVSGHEAAHYVAQWCRACTQKKVKMVWNQGPSVALGLGFFEDAGESFQERLTVLVVEEDLSSFYSPGHDVLKDTGSIKSWLAWHKVIYQKRLRALWEIYLFLCEDGGRDRSTARLTLGVGLAVSAFPLSVPV